MIFAVDFDGTIVTDGTLSTRPGAVQAIKAMHRLGHRIIIHSVRLTKPWFENLDDPDWGGYKERYRELLNVLKRHKLDEIVELWEYPGKPDADVFIDDKAMKPDWDDIFGIYGV